MNGTRHLVWPVGLVGAALVVATAMDSPLTTYGGSDRRLLWLETAAALALLVVGALHSLGLALLGALWLLPEAAGWITGPVAVRTAADATNHALAAGALVIAVLIVARETRVPRPSLTAALVGGSVAVVARLVMVDPFLDPQCWRTCAPNPWLLVDLPATGRSLERIGLAAMAAVAVVLAFSAFRGIESRRALPATALGLVAELLITDLTRQVVAEDGQSTTYVVLFVVTQAGALGLAAVVGLERQREWRLARELAALAESMLSWPAPSTLAAELGRAVHDPNLRIDYWSDRRGAYFDTDGRPVSPPAQGALRTSVARGGRPVARFVHSPAVDGRGLERALGAALRLVLENEALRAATMAELYEVHASRARIVARAADERKRLERNLHDGAQQRVAALSLLVRILRNRAREGPEVVAADRAALLTRAALGELRRVARGIYPAVLVDAGLPGALLDLAQSSSDVAVSVEELTPTRYHGAVEATAYLVTVAALSDARRRGADELKVSAAEHGGRLMVDLRDDRPPSGKHEAESLLDHVRAQSGSLQIRHDGHSTHVTLELPCAS
ncbi:MAG TPA: histidine kinase [Actinomycetes bacterium]|nr:histidine kinase [Actinomycetes bacterium]